MAPKSKTDQPDPFSQNSENPRSILAESTIVPFASVRQNHTFSCLDQWLATRPDCALFSGVAGSADALLVCDIFDRTNQPLLVVAENSKQAETIADECISQLDDARVSYFPSRDAVPYNLKSPFGPTVEARLRVLWQLLCGERRIVVTTAAALLQQLPVRERFFGSVITLRCGDEVPQQRLSAWLVEIGFKRESAVQNIGSFAVRGDIVDIFPFISEHPVRIEFFGDSIESIRQYDVYSQKSIKQLSSTLVFPMREFCLSDSQIATGANAMVAAMAGSDHDSATTLHHQWVTLGDLDGIEWFLHWFKAPSVSLLDYVAPQTLIVWDDIAGSGHRFDECVDNYKRHHERIGQKLAACVSPPQSLLLSPTDVINQLACLPRIFINTHDTYPDCKTYSCTLEPQPVLLPGVPPLVDELRRKNSEGLTVMLVSENLDHASKMYDLIIDACPFVHVYTGFLRSGYIDRARREAIYSDHQIFSRQSRPTSQKRAGSRAPILSLDSLAPGDYVVHVDHGIGRFAGIERISAPDMERDCMVLLYEGRSKLFVPIDDFHKVQKYIGKDSLGPTLATLGSGTWERTKARTKEHLREMAGELLELYARRQHFDGIAFGPDSLWQKEFEDAFMFDPTPDQITAIADIKKDMESTRPMDRLICGDVGFGKTEVAMRAAFKAVQSGYQVAILAPTTILAAQHYTTFTLRMANFPVRIGLASRFLSSAEQRPVLQRVRDGNVDILIGTHRLLSKDVEFKNLGLLIVDEEQRFGVRHKERLKQFRSSVDVLSLSATPIPRTLHMSLVGVRDLTIINTPPRNRLPIQTRVAEFHDDLLKNAIENELERGGQVYVVHNRIQKLDLLRDKIELLVPGARVTLAHGQMDEKELDRIMKEFIAGSFDVLLSTVIIENGLDIPNVNTLVVIRADTLGLSQLYQLRGRVGRSSEQAFAWLLTAPYSEIGNLGLKRLQALEMYTELGSGFQIAMRDLEIRGAGNILGTQQHGFIAAVGFEMYCTLLEEAVRELKGEVIKPKIEVTIDVLLEAYIPTDYIADGATRIAVYQELSAVEDEGALDEIERGLADRFGPVPVVVVQLMLLMRIKIMAGSMGCTKIGISKKGEASCYFAGDETQVKSTLQRFLKGTPPDAKILYEEPICVTWPLTSTTIKEQAAELLTFLKKLAQGMFKPKGN